jgi:hypothetical protein
VRAVDCPAERRRVGAAKKIASCQFAHSPTCACLFLSRVPYPCG